MASKLKPCPFCGSKRLEICRGHTWAFVKCLDCKALGPEYMTVNQAVEKWNNCGKVFHNQK
jgi:Lar family restriction alleviation protein